MLKHFVATLTIILILSVSFFIAGCDDMSKEMMMSAMTDTSETEIADTEPTENTTETEIVVPVETVPVEMTEVTETETEPEATDEVTEPETPPYELKPLYRDEIETDEIVTIWHDFDAYIESGELADYLIYAAGYNDRNCGLKRKEKVDYLYIKTSNDEFNDKISEHVTTNHLDVLSDEIILRFLESFSPTVYFVVGIKPRCR